MKNDNDYNVIVPLNPSDFPEYNDVLKYICNESQDKNIDVTDQQIVERGWEFYESGDLQWTDRTDKNPSPVERFFLNWLPYYLMKTGQKEKAAQTLTDFSFLMQRLRYGAVERVVLDYILFEKELNAVSPQCAAYMDVVRSASHLLRRDRAKNPAYKIVLQVAMGIADDCPVTQAAQRWLTPENSDSPCDWFWMSNVNRPKEYYPNPFKMVIEKNMGCRVRLHSNGDVLSWGENSFRYWDGHVDSWYVDSSSSKKDKIRIWDIETGVCKAVMEGHTCSIKCVLELKSGDILSWSWDKTLRIWSLDGTCKAVMKGHASDIERVLELKTGDILSCDQDKTMRIWSPDGTCKAVMKGHASDIERVLELKSGDILSWSRDKTLCIWSCDGTCKTALDGHIYEIDGVIKLKSGDFLTWNRDKTLRIWSCDGTWKTVFEGHTESISGAIELRSGDILSWSSDKTLRIWSPDGSCKSVLEGHSHWIEYVMELSSGDILSRSKNEMCIWSSNGECKAILEDQHEFIESPVELQSGNILSGGWSLDCVSTKLRLWLPDGTCKAVLEGHTDLIWDVIELKSGDFLTWSRDNTLRMWTSDGAFKAVIEGYTDNISGVEELKSGDILMWSNNKILSVWSPRIACKTELEGHSNMIQGILELKSGDVLSWSNDKTLRLWSPDGVCKAVLIGHTNYVIKAMELRSGDILSLSKDKTLRLWSSGGVCKAVMAGHEGAQRIPKARELNSGDILSWYFGGRMRLWSPDGVCKSILKDPNHDVNEESGNIFSRIWNRLFRFRASNSVYKNGIIRYNDQVWKAKELQSGKIVSWNIDGVLCLWSHKGNFIAPIEGKADEEYYLTELQSGDILLRESKDVLRICSSKGKFKKEIKKDDPQFDSYYAILNNILLQERQKEDKYQLANEDESIELRFDDKPVAQWIKGEIWAWTLSAARIYICYGTHIDFLKLNYGSHQSVSFDQAKQFLNGDIKESDFISYVPKSAN